MAEEKVKTLAQKIADINTKAFANRKAASDAYSEKLKEHIGSSKSRRGPTLAGRISGLQTLGNK